MAAREQALFSPIRVGKLQLLHRIVHAPLTRRRGTRETAVPLLPIVAEYYSQRASKPGTLLITEATTVAPQGAGVLHVPGIYSDEQVAAWREITEAVHAKKCYIFSQLRAYGRAADPTALKALNLDYVAPSSFPMPSRPELTPRALTIPEIRQYVAAYGNAAKRAVNEAKFDGVELHGANGYLLEQFLQDVSNKRTDEYGGSIEGRCRFVLEVLAAVVKEVGEERVAIRLSPWGTVLDMGMQDPKPTYTYLVTRIKELYPHLAYIHVVEPRANGSGDRAPGESRADESNDFIRDIWGERPLISAGGYTRETALRQAEARPNELIAFGRWYISNPDLPQRLIDNIPFTAYDRSTFYAGGDTSGKGYTDYPFAT
ncbi:hypothetical protein PLEOSDRAFT_1038318 [Pleurotus ostreatus PC15]|uniref:NADH:flavin oxidoreductase/NADH oxidase N-terminal domain-containing protein n=1 Tax=Pleurotus ostreatus (strain PC15) TaxID=1137138 RepID=A0A067NKZ2_PLEO1|nr:hypothetical protein PLEOSDRAFT_1038318 [Pleurotus ostreatus PC15]